MAKGKGGGSKERKVYEKTPADKIPDYKSKNNQMPSLSKQAKVSALFAVANGSPKRVFKSFGLSEQSYKVDGRLILNKVSKE